MAAGASITTLPVKRLLEWAFGTEHAQLDLPEDEEAMIGAGYGVGSALRVLRRGEIGTRVDGGGRSHSAEDADHVAAIVSTLPRDCGGAWMAVRVAQYARACVTPDWMPGAVPRCVPRQWHKGPHGATGKTQVERRIRYKHRGRWVERVDLCVPVTYSPSPGEIDAARDHYMAWVEALGDIRDRLSAAGTMQRHAVSEQLPPMMPWIESAHGAARLVPSPASRAKVRASQDGDDDFAEEFFGS